MNTALNTIAISSVVFTSNDPEVLIKGVAKRGKLSFETELLISQTQLNIVLNELRKQNEEFEMDNYLSSERITPQETLFFADLSSVSNATIHVRSFLDQHRITQIRA